MKFLNVNSTDGALDLKAAFNFRSITRDDGVDQNGVGGASAEKLVRRPQLKMHRAEVGVPAHHHADAQFLQFDGDEAWFWLRNATAQSTRQFDELWQTENKEGSEVGGVGEEVVDDLNTVVANQSTGIIQLEH